ncbi:thioesterase II family protein [Streptomyces swartbergensis]|uniref:Thioesterase n=1 Tax=Streptomyces swartbergensis TaxID=487165 RepID=A0A243SB26_9ACTN|nr:thioesterase domain-containing protein [Streptomyces swartbergensis]OUD04871.1 thioesterase [Streptomyces swartbergensis]
MECDAGTATATLARRHTRHTPQPWLRRFGPEPTQPAARLVCFPHAGGGAGAYRPLAAALADATRTHRTGPYEMLAVQYPGRQERLHEERVEDLAELAERAFRAVRPLADRPLTLLGHSMGAVVAYEVARRLEDAGTGPAHLIVSGAWAPDRVRDRAVRLRDDDGLVEELRRTRGTDPRLLRYPDVLAMALPVLRSDYTALETYRHRPGRPLTAPVTALVGDADPVVDVPEAAAWERHTRGPFRLRVFPGGDHFYLTAHWPDLAGHVCEQPLPEPRVPLSPPVPALVR